MKYFHELTKKEYKKLVNKKISYAELARLHPQPIWCNYPDAVMGMMGCWSLVGFMIKKEDDCKNCECYMRKPCETK